MKIFKRIPPVFKEDHFDKSLVHVGGELPSEIRNKIWKELFYPIIRKGFPQNITDEAIEDASLVRLEANGNMHTRIVIDDGFGLGIAAIDVDGRMGDLLWALCRNEEERLREKEE